jgi:hypothetical protein
MHTIPHAVPEVLLFIIGWPPLGVVFYQVEIFLAVDEAVFKGLLQGQSVRKSSCFQTRKLKRSVQAY